VQVLNAILYVAEHGCKLRGLPKPLEKLAHDLSAHESLEQSDRVMYRRRNEIERFSDGSKASAASFPASTNSM
jgi:transposase